MHSANVCSPSENAGPDTSSQVTLGPTKEASVVSPTARQSFTVKNGNYTVIWFSNFDLSLLEVISEKHPVQKSSEEQHKQFIESRDKSVSRDLSVVAAQHTESAVITSGVKAHISAEPLEINPKHKPSHDGGLPKSTQPGLPSPERAGEGGSAILPTNNETAAKNEDDSMQIDEVDEQSVREQVVPVADDMELDSEISFQDQVVKGLQRLHARLSQCVSLMPHSDQDIGSMVSEDQGVITFEPVENVSDKTGMPSPGPSEQVESPILAESTCKKAELPEVDVREAPESGLSAIHRKYPALFK